MPYWLTRFLNFIFLLLLHPTAMAGMIPGEYRVWPFTPMLLLPFIAGGVKKYLNQKEAAFLLFCGAAVFAADGKQWRVSRESEFTQEASCLHVCAGVAIEIRAEAHSELYIQRVKNANQFETKCYLPEDVTVQRAGVTELQGTMRRNIKTIFDLDNAPYSNMVLGEVLNFPGKWSSYPPHFHPQPEVYFYRFDKPQGFGAGFANGELHRTGHNGLLVIQSGFHSQVAVPGYGLCYVWGIRHLPDDPLTG